MIGVLLNAGVILIGGGIGLLFKKAMSDKFQDFLMKSFSLMILYFGFSGSLSGTNTIVEILSLVIGCLIGWAIDIDGKFNALSNKIGSRFGKPGEANPFSAGFANGTIVFCAGAVAIMAPLQAGLSADMDLIYAKSILDLIVAFILAASMGVGIVASAICVLLYEGLIFAGASVAAPYLSEYVIGEISCVGSIAIMAIGFNLLGVTNLKVLNIVPAVFIPIILCMFIK